MFFWVLIALAVLMVASVGFMPQLIRLRIRVLRWLNWNWAARLLEMHFDAWVLTFRVLVLGIAAVLLFFAFGSVANAQTGNTEAGNAQNDATARVVLR